MNINVVQDVFDNKDLRKYILKYVVKAKYEEEIKEFMCDLVKENWYKYCNCIKCFNRKRIDHETIF